MTEQPDFVPYRECQGKHKVLMWTAGVIVATMLAMIAIPIWATDKARSASESAAKSAVEVRVELAEIRGQLTGIRDEQKRVAGELRNMQDFGFRQRKSGSE